MQQTQYYSFLKPEATDDVTPDPFNTNADAIDLALHNLSEDKQDVLSTSQMNALNSGMTTAKREKLDALPTASELNTTFNGKQNTLTTEQLNAVNSGITSEKVAKLDNLPTTKELTSTLTAGQTTITFTDSSITANSTVDVYTSVYGVSPTEITPGTGSITLAFDSQDSDLSVKVVIK